MLSFLRILLALVALVAIVAFAIANRTPVPVSFAPLPYLIELPVYGVFLLGLVVGALVGGIALWLSGIPQRLRARRMRNKIWALENQIEVLKKQERQARAAEYSAERGMVAAGSGG